MLSLTGLIVTASMVMGQAATTAGEAVDNAQEDVAKTDLAKLQGKWELKYPKLRSVKVVEGNKETVTRYNNDGEVVSAHKCEFKLEVKNGVRVFTFSNMEFTEGPEKGSKMRPGFSHSFVYTFGKDTMVHASGFIVGRGVREPELYTWKRIEE